MEARIRRVEGGDSQVVSFVVALRDIAEEVEARAERDRRESDLARLLDSSPMPSCASTPTSASTSSTRS